MRRLLLACALVVAVVGLMPATATAAGGYCTGSGVNVVVDFGALGGGVQKGCGHGSTAAAAIESAGFKLGYNPRMGAGFVCTVDGKPADGNCAQTNAYWGLFIAKAGGSWTYANLGADSQPVTDGQTASFAWQSSASRRKPGVAPAAKAPAASAKPTPTHETSGHAAKPAPTKAATAAPPASASPTPAASTRAKPHHRASAAAAPTASASVTPSASPDSTAEGSTLSQTAAKTDSGGGLPWWIPAGVVVLLVGGGGTAMWLRRSRGVS
jgi:hypothetical protein